ncbi:CREB/ATF bZIP transcription factor [Spea bombifrons]|uniref:CREB/ATF bZIP transcription factor n=1 Tax=Spea bombifrons TaxID=233779 RepID=UPI00234B2C6A|nr:CREB/ATF bZIP transcription factor [Spea bombifrons]
MRHRLKDRAKITASPPSRRRTTVRSGRRRDKKASSAEWPEVDGVSVIKREESPQADAGGCTEWRGQGYEGSFQSVADLDELLDIEEASDWGEEGDRSQSEDSPFADLLQQLVGCVDMDTTEINSRPFRNAASSSVSANMAHANEMAAPYTKKMAAAGSPTVSSRKSARYEGNKNALAARLNRLRKKEYVSGLESRVTRLADENQQLQRERQALGARVRELEHEARYLRAVLANDSALSQLLGRLTGFGGVRLTTSLFRDPPEFGDHDYALPGVKGNQEDEEEEAPSSGVCLHVDKERVSVEFCASCSQNASSANKIFSFR